MQDELREEVEEVLEDIKIDEELADVLEVIHSIAKYKNISFEDIEKKRLEKKEKRGGFDDRVILNL